MVALPDHEGALECTKNAPWIVETASLAAQYHQTTLCPEGIPIVQPISLFAYDSASAISHASWRTGVCAAGGGGMEPAGSRPILLQGDAQLPAVERVRFYLPR